MPYNNIREGVKKPEWERVKLFCDVCLEETKFLKERGYIWRCSVCGKSTYEIERYTGWRLVRK